MKKELCFYAIVKKEEVSSLVTSSDPLASSRLPTGVVLTVQPQLRWVTATGNMKKDWQAVVLLDEANDELYFISPRVFLGLSFRAGKLERSVQQPFPSEPLMTYLATRPKVKLTEYKSVSVEDYEDKSVDVNKDYPVFELVP